MDKCKRLGLQICKQTSWATSSRDFRYVDNFLYKQQYIIFSVEEGRHIIEHFKQFFKCSIHQSREFMDKCTRLGIADMQTNFVGNKKLLGFLYKQQYIICVLNNTLSGVPFQGIHDRKRTHRCTKRMSMFKPALC
jgi:hypothetical protein